MWSGIGRVVNLTMYGLTVRETMERREGPGILDRLSSAATWVHSPSHTTLPTCAATSISPYEEAFPNPCSGLAMRPGRRGSRPTSTNWSAVMPRPLTALATLPGLRRYFEALCVNTAGIVEDKTVYDAAGISRMTAGAYERLLSDLFVFEALPAWSNNRLSRLVKSSKRHITDPSLVTAALHLDERGILRDGNLLGRIIDTFVLSQIRPEAQLSPLRPRLHHLREKDGRHEIDLLAELAGGDVIAIEIKASASPICSLWH